MSIEEELKGIRLALEKIAGGVPPVTWEDVDDPMNPFPDVYQVHGFDRFVYPKDERVFSSIAIITKDTALFADSGGGNIEITVRNDKNNVHKLLKDTVVLVFPQSWNVMYDGDHKFVEFIGVFEDTTFRGSYIPRECVEWIHKEGGQQ